MSVQGKQQSALLFCASSVPSVMLLAKMGWLLAGAAAILTSILCVFLRRGELPKVTLVWNYIALGAAAELLCSAYEQGNELIGLLLLLLAAYAAGKNAMHRIAAVAIFILAILYCMLLGFSLPTIDSIKPCTSGKWYLLASALTPMLFVNGRGANKWSLGAFVLLTLTVALVTAGSESFYAAMKSVSILGIMQRLEPLVSVALTIGGFCLLGAICNVNRELLGRAERWNAVLNFILGGIGIWLSRMIGAEVLAIGTAIFWGILPLATQFLEKLKKFEKN